MVVLLRLFNNYKIFLNKTYIKAYATKKLINSELIEVYPCFFQYIQLTIASKNAKGSGYKKTFIINCNLRHKFCKFTTQLLIIYYMKNIKHLKLAIGFGLISSISFGQTTEKKVVNEKKEEKTVPVSTEKPMKLEKKENLQKEENVKSQELNRVESKEVNEVKQEKEIKKVEKVKPVEAPVTVKPKPPIK